MITCLSRWLPSIYFTGARKVGGYNAFSVWEVLPLVITILSPSGDIVKQGIRHLGLESLNLMPLSKHKASTGHSRL